MEVSVMPGTIQVMVVDDSDETRESVKMLLQTAANIQIIAEAKDGAEALQRLSVVTPDVVLMDINMPVMDGGQATERICMLYPNISVIVLSVQNDVEYVRKCMRAGAKDYLFKPVTTDVLISTIEQVYATAETRNNRNTVAVLSDHFSNRSKVISIISAKGGVGKTTVAVNAAAALAEQGKQVVLVDLDLQFGDASLFMNAAPTRTVLDLVQESNEIDPDVLDRYLAKVDNGLHLLAGPKRPEQAEYVTPSHVRVILQSLRKKFEYVIVDTSPLANDVFFAIMETSDDCYMVHTLNLAVLKNNRMLLDLFTELGYDIAVMKHLLNRANSKNGLKVKDVNKVLKTDIVWEMDNDYQFVETSINEGTPFVIRDKQHRLTKQIYALTARMDETQGNRLSRRNPLRKMFAGKR
jgi:pilus assembly protein CpaE